MLKGLSHCGLSYSLSMETHEAKYLCSLFVESFDLVSFTLVPVRTEHGRGHNMRLRGGYDGCWPRVAFASHVDVGLGCSLF